MKTAVTFSTGLLIAPNPIWRGKYSAGSCPPAGAGSTCYSARRRCYFRVNACFASMASPAGNPAGNVGAAG